MPTDADLPATSLSIWPYDTSTAPDSVPEGDFRRLRCFVLCPFKRAGTVFPILEAATETVEKVIGDDHDIKVYYAGDLTGSSAIHPDIWTQVAQADIVVADITDYNPNVLYELGVAAAWRPQSTVIILRDRCDGRAEAFDLSPARQIIYESSSRHWMQFLSRQLVRSMLTCLASVPFTGEPEVTYPEAFEVALSDGKDTDYLWSPGPGHKKFLDDGLEFGSPYYFRYSWLSPPGWRPQNVRVAAEMRFSLRIDPCWVGIALRSQGYWAGNSYLAWLDEKGRVMRTAPGVDARVKDEEQVGQLPEFDPSDDSFVHFSVSIDQELWRISVGDVQFDVPLGELPHVFPRGRILLQAYRCRAIVRNVTIEVLE
jgi:hypothetical protein